MEDGITFVGGVSFWWLYASWGGASLRITRKAVTLFCLFRASDFTRDNLVGDRGQR